jgi:hypothetical protein
MEDLPTEAYNGKVKPFPTGNCSHCVFSFQNEMLENLINPTGMEDFV